MRITVPRTVRRIAGLSEVVFRFLNADKHTFEMYDGNDKQMEITYTRQ